MTENETAISTEAAQDTVTMREVTHEEYLEFARKQRQVQIGESKIELRLHWQIKKLGPPPDYEPERTTVWSFPDRGDWATHRGDYRGNWSPYIPRNLILKYSREGDWVLDPMMGSGTTLVEARLLNRNAIGVDINYEAVIVARDRLNFSIQNIFAYKQPEPQIKTYVGDARHLDLIPDNSIDLVCTHPPYASIISYSRKNQISGDLSQMPFDQYMQAMKEVARELYRVLKGGGHCAILIGDTRKNKHYVPIAYRVMQQFLEVGFILREDIIKLQWNMKTTREKWRGRNYDFYLIAHEHIFVFRKPEASEKLKKYRLSMSSQTT